MRRDGLFMKLLRNRKIMAGVTILLLFTLCGIFAPLLAPHDPYEVNPSIAYQFPLAGYPLGTDEFGRCIFSRILYGARLTLPLSLLSLAIAMVIGIPAGLLSGYYKPLDGVIMRLTDLFLAFPGMLLAIAIVAILGSGVYNVTIAVGLGTAPVFARLVRGEVLSLKQMPYVEAAKTSGASGWRIILLHILPNCLSTIAVFAAMQMAWIIMSMSTLSFLGMGAQAPSAEWGAMASGGKNYIGRALHISAFPVVFIFLSVLSFNMLGNGIRDALDPRISDGNL